MVSETQPQELKITYMVTPDGDGKAPPPHTIGWLDSLAFIKQMVTGYMIPDPVTRERCIYDHGEIELENKSRIYFYWDSTRNRLVWEEEEQPPTDVVCPQCKGTGSEIVDDQVVIGTRCLKCSGTRRVVYEPPTLPACTCPPDEECDCGWR